MEYILLFILVNVVLSPFVKKDSLYFVPVVMGAIGLAGAIVKGIQAAKQASLANGINPDDPTYKTSQFAKDNLGLATNLMNGRMAGAADLERNIQGSQSNAIGSIERNATNSQQALALAQGAQGQTNAALQNLQVNEAQNKYGLAGAVYNANRDLVNEGDKEYNDQLRKFNNDVAAKSALRQASANNISGIFNDLTSGAMIAGSLHKPKVPTSSQVNYNSAVLGQAPINTSLAIPQPLQGSLNMGNLNTNQSAPYFFNPLQWRR